MDHDAATRRRQDRRRLLAAAAASVLLHGFLTGGLGLVRLGRDRPDEVERAAAPPLKPKVRRDFALEVPKSAADARPAHARPLDLPRAEPPRRVVQERPQPDRAVAQRRPDEPSEQATPGAAAPSARPATPRDADLAGADAPARAPAMAAAVDARADLSAGVAAPQVTAPAAVAPAAAPARERPAAAAVSSQWRPREVALLERLTARSPALTPSGGSDGDEPAPRPTPQALDRAAATARTGTPRGSADEVAAPAGAAAPFLPGPRAPERRPAPRPAAAAVASTVGDADGTDAADPAAVPDGTAAIAARAAARAAREGPGRLSDRGGPAPTRRGATVDARTDAHAATIDATGGITAGTEAAAVPDASAAARRTPGGGAARGALGARSAATAPDDADGPGTPAPTASTAGAAGIATLGTRPAGADAAAFATAAPLMRAGVAGGVTSGSGAGPVDGMPGAAPGGTQAEPAATSVAASGPLPAAVGRRAGRGTAAAALGAAVGRAATGSDPGAGDEGLSTPAIAAVRGADVVPRRGDADASAPAGPTALERVAASSLPVEGRVRDVAAAFRGRNPAGRSAADAIPPADADAATAARATAVVDDGLAFLARAQQEDGRWCLGRFAGSTAADVPQLASDTAATGLALLAFLGAGHDHFDGPHRDTVRRGVEFLLAIQKPDGDLYVPADDLSNSCAWLYSHGIASMALCEVVGMTGDPLVKPAAARACRFIASSQHPDRGGWRYTPRSDADLSVSGWMLVALRAGTLAGVETEPRAFAGVRRLLDASWSPEAPARFAYNPRNADQRRSELSIACMTAVGTLMRLHTGTQPTDPQVVAAARALEAFPPSYGTAGRKLRDSYLWYYASQVLVHTGGDGWKAWYAALLNTLAQEQSRSGPTQGSWDPLGVRPDRWGRYGGRIYVTALHLLALEVPSRRLPTAAAVVGPAGR